MVPKLSCINRSGIRSPWSPLRLTPVAGSEYVGIIIIICHLSIPFFYDIKLVTKLIPMPKMGSLNSSL